MHIADPARLKPPVESVAAFRCDPESLATRLRATFVDPLSAPGPARLGAIQLDNGTTVGVVIHDHGSFAEILAQLSTDIERTLVESFTALDVAVSDIQWIRNGIDQSAVVAAIAASVEREEKHGSPVELAPQFETPAQEMLLTDAESKALTLLVLQASRDPYLAPVIGDTDIRMMRVPRTVLAEGIEIAPLAIFYRIASNDSVVTILDVQRLGASDVYVSDGTFLDAAYRVMSSSSDLISVSEQREASVLHHRPRTVASTVLDADEIRRRAS
jgi:hypothetical protein